MKDVLVLAEVVARRIADPDAALILIMAIYFLLAFRRIASSAYFCPFQTKDAYEVGFWMGSVGI